MSITMAGSRGGIQARSASRVLVDRFLNLLDGFVEEESLLAAVRAVRTGPGLLTFAANNACNLRCRHCYLQPLPTGQRHLDSSEWTKLLDSVPLQPPEAACVVGKEVFLGTRGLELLHGLVERRRAGRSYRVGTITNGTLLEPFRSDVETLGLDFLDISLDGPPRVHDRVRGAGAFDLAWPNVKWAAQAFGDRFTVAFTLQSESHLVLPSFVDLLARNGVSRVVCSFYIPLTYTDGSLGLGLRAAASTLRTMRELRRLRLPRPFAVLFDLDVTQPLGLEAFLASEWFDPALLAEDVTGSLFVEHEFENGVRLQFRLLPFPIGLSRIRITHDGALLVAEDAIDAHEYSATRLGSVRDADYSIPAAVQAARSTDRPRKLVRGYLTRIAPRLVTAARLRRSSQVWARRYPRPA